MLCSRRLADQMRLMTFPQWFELLKSVFETFLLFLQRIKVSRSRQIQTSRTKQYSMSVYTMSALSFRPRWTSSETWFRKFWTQTRRTGYWRRPILGLQVQSPHTARQSCRGRPSWPTSPTRVCSSATPWTRPSCSSSRSRIKALCWALGSSRVGQRLLAASLPLGPQIPPWTGSRTCCTSLDFSLSPPRVTFISAALNETSVTPSVRTKYF